MSASRPLSELYGRKISIFTSFFLFAILQIPVAVAQNVQSVIIFRFLQGFAGSAPVVVVGGVLADIWDARERGFAVPCFAGALFAGPVLAPIVYTLADWCSFYKLTKITGWSFRHGELLGLEIATQY